MNTDSFIVYIKTDDNYKDIAEDVETKLDTSNYDLDRPFPKWKSKKIIGLMKYKLDQKIMIQFVGLIEKAYIFLTDDSNEDKKAKGTKNCVTKRKFKFENYKNCLEANQLDNKINYLEKNNINLDSLKKDHKELMKKQ